MANKRNPVTTEEILDAITKTNSMHEASIMLHVPFNTFIRRTKELNIYKPNQGRKGLQLTEKQKKAVENRTAPLQEILEGKHPNISTRRVKEQLFKTGLKKRVCEFCGQNEIWNGKPLVLELDHINGVKRDHKLENLRILCLHCHSQTPTYRNKNRI